MTINEIAEMAGVSRATVSRYLNHGYVSQEKRERIKEAIEKTGYQPSTQAQTLRTKKTKLVGVILPKISSDTVSRMVAGISDVLSKRGYQLLLANTNNDIEEELKYLNLFKDNQVDGILFIATIFSARHKKILKECRVPVVILGQRLDGFSCVYQDDFHAALQITERMLRHGRIPAYIGVTDRDEAAGLSRRMGFEAALAAAGIPMRPELMVEGDFSIESGSKNMQSLLEKEPKLDCVFCATDNIAVGAAACLKSAGKQIPRDVQVAGTGDTPIGRYVTPGLTTVHFYYKTSGKEAAAMLVEQMEDGRSVNKELKMGFEIIENGSTIS